MLTVHPPTQAFRVQMNFSPNPYSPRVTVSPPRRLQSQCVLVADGPESEATIIRLEGRKEIGRAMALGAASVGQDGKQRRPRGGRRRGKEDAGMAVGEMEVSLGEELAEGFEPGWVREGMEEDGEVSGGGRKGGGAGQTGRRAEHEAEQGAEQGVEEEEEEEEVVFKGCGSMALVAWQT
ncbi:uncharacterized protein CLAFUR5_02405 [Fulvia fulva]|uniref:Uncharacterized protein n=1 Tax=Passalora fulva TaxID=5499 RepID=A0A9Q8LBJ0_PASFU|nr:uncharacterized protein CLAFUR5_02405 [Fulvia fulva]UJO14388.1 hypothetical protein CLAFUR5_02405 [Fulvia fulva]